MQIRYLLIVMSLCLSIFSEGASEPGWRGKLRWSRRKRRQSSKKQRVRKPPRPQKTLKDSFRDAIIKQVKIIETKLIKSAHHIGRVIKSADLKDISDKVKQLDSKIKQEAQDKFNAAVAVVLETYHPRRLKDQYGFKDDDDVIESATMLQERIKQILSNFEDQVISILQDPRMTNVTDEEKS